MKTLRMMSGRQSHRIVLVFFLTLFLISPSFPYILDEDSFEVIHLSNKVIVLTGVLLPAGCQVTAISTERGIVVVDATGSFSLAREFRQMIEKEFERNDFTYLINTHDHADHTNGNRAFTDAVIIGHELCQKAMQKRKRQWTKEFILDYKPQFIRQIDQYRTRLRDLNQDSDQAEIVRKQISSAERVLSDIEKISADEQVNFVIPPNLTFTERMTLDMKDMHVHLYYFGNYHSDNDIFIHVPEEGILMVGDTFSKIFLPGTSSNVRKVDVPLWLEVLDAVLAEPYELKHAVRGHTVILTGEEIIAIRDYMKEMWSGISIAHSKGLSLEDIQKRFPLDHFSYITNTKNQDETEIRRQHQIIVQGFWKQLQGKEFAFEKLMQLVQEIDLNTFAGIRLVIDAYGEMESNRDEYFFHEAVVNNYANRFIQANFIDEAIEVMKLHIKVFPESSDAFAILGDAYAAKGEAELAIHNLRISLELDPGNVKVKEKLMNLKEKQK